MPLSAVRAVICARRMSSKPDFATILELLPLLGAKHLLQLRRRLARLRTVRLIGDHGESFALGRRQLSDLFQRERKGLDGADDDLLVPGERLGKFAALAAAFSLDGGYNAGGPLEIEDGVLQLLVDDIAVADTTITESKTFRFSASCRSAKKCAVHAIEFVFPEPAECWIRYLPPVPSASTARTSFRVASSW